MDSFMQCWKRATSGCFTIPLPRRVMRVLAGLLAAVALAACAGAPGAIDIRDASIAGGALSARLAWQPDSEVLDALDHGIALNFVVTVRAQTQGLLGIHRTLAVQQRHLQLRYYPLTRQYQLRDLDRNQARSYAARALALAAFEELRLPLTDWSAAKAARYQLRIELDRDALPGALRLPALWRSAWHISSGTYSWPAPVA